MCGIAGFLNLDALDAASILARLAHRGPDGEGSLEIAPGSGLMQTRLAIIDLTDAGRQPMRDGRSGNVVVFNGEIYNYRDLRRELDDGEPWESHSDTEVILRAWRRWGIDAFSKLRGMFALSIWDAASRSLFLARDRFGIKPLYFARRGKSFAFASELRALMATGIVEKRIDPARLGEYLRFQSGVGTGALVEGVELLGAGGWGRVSEEGGVEVRRWVEGGGGEAPAGSRRNSRQGAGAPETESAPKTAGAAIVAAFDEAVRLHLESDVPVGAFLSGGLDSAAIVGTLKQLGVRPKTFTVGWDSGDDESVAARCAAEFAGADHHEVTLSHAEALAMVPEAVEYMDSPSADGVNSYVVSWAVRQQGLKVALSGLGGDELFGGYPSFTRARSFSARMFRATPRALRWPFGAAAAAASGYSSQIGKAADLLRGPGTLTDLYLEGRALFSRDQVVRLTGRAAGEHPTRDALLSLESSLDGRPGTFMSHAEMMTYMHDTLLRDTDQMSMAHGLEVRVPFLDGVFARTVLELGDEVKFGVSRSLDSPSRSDGSLGMTNIDVGRSLDSPSRSDGSLGMTNGRVTKPLLVEAFSDRIPKELHSLPKRGFSLPMRQWMRGPLREFCLDRLRSTALRDAGVDAAAAMEVWKAFEDDRAKWSRPWALVVLGDWAGRNL